MRSSSVVVWSMCAGAAAMWIGVFFFASAIAAQKEQVADVQEAGKTASEQRAAGDAALSLASATALERQKIETIVNRDILTLSNLVGEVGQDVGVPLSIVSVTPGPGPALPKGFPLHPQSALFSVKASGSFAQMMTAASLLASLPALSNIESLQLSRSETPGVWNLNATVGVVTGSEISS